MLRRISTQLIEHTQDKLATAWSLQSYTVLFLSLEGILQPTERETWTVSQSQNCQPKTHPALKMCWGDGEFGEKSFPMTCCCTHSSRPRGLSSFHQRDCLWQQMRARAQIHTLAVMQKESWWEISIWSPSLKLGEHLERGEGKIVGVRVEGGHQENMAH